MVATTNLGTLRAYLDATTCGLAWGIHRDMTLMVRQLAPTTDGLCRWRSAVSRRPPPGPSRRGIQADVPTTYLR